MSDFVIKVSTWINLIEQITVMFDIENNKAFVIRPVKGDPSTSIVSCG